MNIYRKVFTHGLPLCLWLETAAGMAMPPFDCIVTPSMTVDVSSPVPGTLAEVLVDRSDPVDKGQVIARMNSAVEKANVMLAREKADQMTEIKLWETNLNYDSQRYDWLSSLYTRKAVSTKDKDDSERNLEISRWRVQQARDANRLRQLELKRAEADLAQKTITSPINGVVVQRFKSPAEYVEQQPILRVAQLDPLYVEAILPMQLFGRITPGMQAEVTPDTRPPIRTTVTVVDKTGNAASSTFGVRLELPNPGYELPAGLTCSVKFFPRQGTG